MGIFYREKAFHAGKKKSGKITLPPQKNMPVTPLGVTQVCHMYTCATKQMQKRGHFLREKGIHKNRDYGVKKYLFSWKRGFHFFTSNPILLRGYYQTKSSLGGKIWLQNGAKFMLRGVFSSKRWILIRVYFENLLSCMHTHCKLVSPSQACAPDKDICGTSICFYFGNFKWLTCRSQCINLSKVSWFLLFID